MRAAILVLTLLVFSTDMPAARNDLPPCPASPNCVSTKATDPQHAIAPMHYHGPRASAMHRLEQLLRAMPRVRITRIDSDSIHAEFRTAVFRFVDDVDFVFDDDGTIHFRSASRVGYSDLGVNRRRMETIRSEWTRDARTPSVQ